VRIATWNINSVRLRIDLVLRFLESHRPDVLCLQETKVVRDLFPADAFRELGYGHIAIAGMKGYNGVAILSSLPIDHSESLTWCDRDDARHIAVRLVDGPEIHNLYIPSGGDVPDPANNPKFAHKLAFVEELTAWLPGTVTRARGQGRDVVVVGDLNIAPMENDVWSHKQMLGVISHTPAEVEALNRLQQASGMIDASRHFVPAEEKLFSWWSYRSRDWSTSDRGRRLDHVWVTPGLGGRLRDHGILRDARGWLPKPSDHVPVWVDID
jgi:exodeoxyribonuclease-3